MKLKWYYKLMLSLISALLFCCGWSQWGLGPLVWIAFVPLLIIEEHDYINRQRFRTVNSFLWSFLSFLIWNAITTYWIYYSTVFGAIAAIFFLSLFMACVFWSVAIIKRKMGPRIGLLAFVSFWLSFEYLFMNSQISWPWLTLGNAFANNITLIQWYEFTGHLGGSLWVLLLNVLIFLFVRDMFLLKKKPVNRKNLISLILLILVPIGYSVVRYYTYSEKPDPVDIVVIQPNIDPYNEKFETPSMDQLSDMLTLADQKMDSTVDVIVGPETAIPDGMWESEMDDERTIRYLKAYLQHYPKAVFIMGADTRDYYPDGVGKSETAIAMGKTGNYYDLYNTALLIDTSPAIQAYHKSKLVPGVEMMPYPKLLGFLGDFAIDLGGMSGSHGVQAERTPMQKSDGLKIGTAICYESAYGEFFAGFVKEGAGIMCVITNDGWWGNTAGHRQHKSFSSLRAVETRRCIARSANTGISCFVNQRGDILQATEWWKKDVIRATVNANDTLTFYTRYGDFLARMSLVISGILIVVFFMLGLMNLSKRSSRNPK
ncbi:MAG: apolipoprotein N-acyltransferase [Bacteroidales bacterium]|nr:apolipoprotein N-acyltransferase [Bacteroidales bacterium]HOY38732.1 apolipoprotein N-acyltransferase [Bacteroidales bacterium]HQP03495.1 apolipoprotein N-acyltransferase [Bacteroidales bacterium]